ncbi:hypothetical protein H0X48_03180 [Candidatus Dependentiae bacterium]|nr:hypothetical protein [Candidatus Dependentiae bacterium]
MKQIMLFSIITLAMVYPCSINANSEQIPKIVETTQFNQITVLDQEQRKAALESEERKNKIKLVGVCSLASALITTYFSYHTYNEIIGTSTKLIRDPNGDYITHVTELTSSTSYQAATVSSLLYVVAGFCYFKPQVVERAYCRLAHSYSQKKLDKTA